MGMTRVIEVVGNIPSMPDLLWHVQSHGLEFRVIDNRNIILIDDHFGFTYDIPIETYQSLKAYIGNIVLLVFPVFIKVK